MTDALTNAIQAKAHEYHRCRYCGWWVLRGHEADCVMSVNPCKSCGHSQSDHTPRCRWCGCGGYR